MRLVVSQSELNQACRAASVALSKKGTLPILAYFLIQTYEGRARLSASNLEMAVVVDIAAMNEEDGAICVPGKLFAQLVSKASKDSRFDLETNGDALVVKNGAFENKLLGRSAEDFPPIPECFDPLLTIDPDVLFDAMSQTAYCVATEDTRPVLKCVDWRVQDNVVTLAASDGFRLAVYKAKCTGPDFGPLLIPGAVLSKAAPFLKGIKEPVRVMYREQHSSAQVALLIDKTLVVIQCPQGTFPNYGALIPQSCAIHIDMAGADLKAAVASVRDIANDGAGIVRFELFPGQGGRGKLAVMATSQAFGNARYDIDCQFTGVAQGPDGGRIAFQWRYLTELLGHLNAVSVSLEMTTPSSPGVFRRLDDTRYLHMIMPMGHDAKEK